MNLPRLYQVLIPVWGQHYMEKFLRLSLPGLLAPGNLSALPRDRSTVRIITTPADAERMKADPIFERLCATLPVEVDLGARSGIEAASAYRQTVKDLNRAYTRYTEAPELAGSAFFFFASDFVFASGYVQKCLDLLASGVRAVHVAGVRAVYEDLLEALEVVDGVMSVDSATLLGLLLKTMHGETLSHLIEDDCRSIGFHLWGLPGVGLVAHHFHSHPLLVWPRYPSMPVVGSIEHEYVRMSGITLDECHLVEEPAEMMCCEISARAEVPQGKVVARDELVGWMKLMTNVIHRQLGTRPVFYVPAAHRAHFDTLATTTTRLMEELVLEHDRATLSMAPYPGVAGYATTVNDILAFQALRAAQALRQGAPSLP